MPQVRLAEDASRREGEVRLAEDASRRGGRLAEGGGRLAEGEVREEDASRREASRMGGGTGQLTSGACLCREASGRVLVPVCQLSGLSPDPHFKCLSMNAPDSVPFRSVALPCPR